MEVILGQQAIEGGLSGESPTKRYAIWFQSWFQPYRTVSASEVDKSQFQKSGGRGQRQL